MRRSLNIRLLLILLLAVGSLGAGIYYYHGWQVKHQIQTYLQKAEQAITDKDPKLAREYLERYLLLQPDNFQAMNQYAMLLDDSAQTEIEKNRAFMTLEKALRQYVSKKGGSDEKPPDELRKRAAIRAMNLTPKRYRDAITHLEPLIKSSPQDIELKEMLAESTAKLKELDKAEKLYEEIIALAPKRLKSYQSLSKLYLDKQDAQKAETCLKQMVLQNPKSLEARLGLINFLLARGRADEAVKENEIAKQLISSEKIDAADKNRAELLLSSVQLVLSQNKPNQEKIEEAIQLYSQGISQFPRDIRFYFGKAQLELGRGPEGKAAALALLHQAIPLIGDELDPKTLVDKQFTVAKLLIDLGDKPEAIKLIDGLRNKHGAVSGLEYLRARLLYEEGKIGEAVAIQERIKDSLANEPQIAVEADLLLTLAYEQLGNADRRLAAFDRILKNHPAMSRAQVGKADTLASLGRQPEALEIYRKQLSSVPAVRFPLIRLLIATELKKNELQRDWTEVNTLLNQSTTEEKKTKDYTLCTFQLLSSTGKYGELEKAIDQACRDNPREVTYWLAKLALISQRPGQDESARDTSFQQALQEAVAAAGDLPELRMAKALQAIKLPPDKVLPALQLLESDTEKWSPAKLLALRNGLANIYHRVGFDKDAKRLLNQVLESNAANFAALQLLIDISLEEKDDSETQRLIKLLREKEGEEGFRWRMSSLNRLFAKLQSGERSVTIDARKLLDELSKLRPSWNQVATAQGRFLELLGQVDQALEQYKRAINQGERNPDIIKKTVQLLTMRRRPEEAKQVLALVLDQNNFDPSYTKLATEVSLSSSDTPSQTLAKAKQSVRSDSKDYREHLWLGNVQWAAKDKSGAEVSLKKALALAQDKPEVWANWLVYLINVDRKNEAASELKRAEGILKDNMTYVLIAYYQALNQRDKAEEQYVKLVKSNPTDLALFQSLVSFYMKNGEFAKAEELLKKQMEVPPIQAGILAWVRRNYAITLAMKGDYPSYRQALALVEQNLKEYTSSPEDLRTRAIVLSTRLGPREGIIKDLETSFSALKPNPGEAILLAQLYEDDGNWKKAASILDEMVREKEGASPRYLVYYIQALIRNKQLVDAEKWMKELETVAPNDNIIVVPKARLLFAKGEKKTAVDLLRSNADHQFKESKNPSVLLTTAALLEEFKEIQEAEILLRQFVSETSSTSPGSFMTLVGFLARQGRVADAINLSEKSWSKLPVGQVSMGVVAALHSGKPSKEEMQIVEKRLLAVSSSEKFDLGVAIALADLFGMQKRTEEAEALYRKILKQDSVNPIALNNLAWLLSDRPDSAIEATSLINRAIDQAGPLGALLDTKGMIYMRSGKLNDAIKEFSEAVQKDPNAQHWLHLAYAQHQGRNTADAERSWQKMLTFKLDAEQLSDADRMYYKVLENAYRRQ